MPSRSQKGVRSLAVGEDVEDTRSLLSLAMLSVESRDRSRARLRD
jgi:hypothetical protein